MSRRYLNGLFALLRMEATLIIRILLGALALVTLYPACGDGSADKTTPDAVVGTYGTCDRVMLVGGCIESTGPQPSITNQHQGCTEAGGTWSTSQCPAANLVGCCQYTFGLDFRECWYKNSPTTNPQASCAKMTGSTWSPAQ
jgi:hypothetical protein